MTITTDLRIYLISEHLSVCSEGVLKNAQQLPLQMKSASGCGCSGGWKSTVLPLKEEFEVKFRTARNARNGTKQIHLQQSQSQYHVLQCTDPAMDSQVFIPMMF